MCVSSCVWTATGHLSVKVPDGMTSMLFNWEVFNTSVVGVATSKASPPWTRVALTAAAPIFSRAYIVHVVAPVARSPSAVRSAHTRAPALGRSPLLMSSFDRHVSP